MKVFPSQPNRCNVSSVFLICLGVRHALFSLDSPTRNYRYRNHFNRLLSWKTICSTLSFSRITKLLTLSIRLSPDTVWRKLISAPCIFDLWVATHLYAQFSLCLSREVQFPPHCRCCRLLEGAFPTYYKVFRQIRQRVKLFSKNITLWLGGGKGTVHQNWISNWFVVNLQHTMHAKHS